MKREPDPSERSLKLGITPVGLSFIGFFVMIGVATGGMWLLKLIMAFFRWFES